MKDTRVTVFRKTLENVIESLDATVRVARWTGTETIPEPLKESASHLVVRLGTADRLASSNFTGSPPDIVRVNAMLGALRRLDAAYVTYRRQLSGTPRDHDAAASALGGEVDEVKADARWRS